MLKNIVQSLFFSLLFLMGAIRITPCLALGSVNSSLQAEYQAAMVEYKTAVGNFNRDKQLYLASTTETNRQSLLASATATFTTRQTVLIRYIDFLSATVQAYVTDGTIRDQLLAQLSDERSRFAEQKPDFSDLSQWYQIDSDFTSVYSRFNETASRAFAYIYWSELNSIIDTYVGLYQRQNGRILEEASSAIERTRKAEVLQQVNRKLSDLQASIAYRTQDLAKIDSPDKYIAFRDRLNGLLAETQASLKMYDALEH